MSMWSFIVYKYITLRIKSYNVKWCLRIECKRMIGFQVRFLFGDACLLQVNLPLIKCSGHMEKPHESVLDYKPSTESAEPEPPVKYFSDCIDKEFRPSWPFSNVTDTWITVLPFLLCLIQMIAIKTMRALG